ncbi:MAG: fasciclin domain-containing protein [Nocardioidaceae bacterium]
MFTTRSIRQGVRTMAAALAATTLVAAGASAPAQAAAKPQPKLGEKSLAAVLTSDGNRFDKRGRDYDIVTEAVLAVLAAKPDSAVGVLTDGSVRLTAFIPNDYSFKVLVKDLTGHWPTSEKAAFDTLVSAVGVDAVEQVLLYHVVPGATITSKTALGADGAELDTALAGSSFTVHVIYPAIPVVQLEDGDSNDVDPLLNPNQLDINKGNKQIAHGILLVLRPIDL